MTCLSLRNWPPWIAHHNAPHNWTDSCTRIPTPYKVITRSSHKKLIFARRDRRGYQRFWIEHVLVRSGGREPGVDRFVNAEDEEDEEEGGEELEEGGALLAPWQKKVLLGQGLELLKEERKPALQLGCRARHCKIGTIDSEGNKWINLFVVKLD